MTIAYLDVKASVSGNVILAAFVSAGLPLAVIQNTVAQVPFQDPWNITAEPTMRGGGISHNFNNCNSSPHNNNSTHSKSRVSA